MRSLVAVSAALLLATACGESGTPKPAETTTATTPTLETTPSGPVQGAAESLAPEAVKVPAAIGAGIDLFEGLAAGGSAIIKTDACPAAYDNSGKLGSISCNAQYTVFYEAPTMRWVAIGPDRGLNGATSAAKNPGPVPSEHVVVIWGLSLAVKPDTFEALHGDGTIIGHLVHSAAATAAPSQAPKPANGEPAKPQ